MNRDPLTDLGLSDEDQEHLARFRFDFDAFRSNREALAAGAFGPERNQLKLPVEKPPAGRVQPWPEGEDREVLAARGRAALEAGEVASLVLNGGMATRFGGVVKGVVEVLPGESFLALKLKDIAAAPGRTPVFLMNSFATDADTKTHLEAHGLGSGVECLTQGISIRCTPEGEVYFGGDGRPSFYAPGHGDVFSTLSGSPGFRAFVERGGKVVMVSNVDNLAATLDPLVIGAHLSHPSPVTVEVAPKNPGDKGGAPAWVDGRVQVIEGFRFPADFDQDQITVFNTNTMSFDVSAFENEPELTWFRADKKVDNAPVVQFERLMGEATSRLDSHYLEVKREGPEGRFMPVKTPADLDELRETIATRLGRSI
ncbi:MAG: UTP--glucose-1-phosphate uridylyltransferase [Myxococcota bacterium]